MTRAEWDALGPRERDAVVAEKVMGWVRPTREFQPWDTSPDEFPGCCLCTPHELPAFTTDIAAAWKVVEKMRAGGWWWSLCNLMDTPGMEWRAELRDPRRLWDANGHHLAGAVSAPEAICIAALTALGHMED